ncbi:hypothetical protein [Sphingomonas sp. PAMC 26621]|uniref:hypothetical protein n=1 Tax=Sphingomonas sp. PAMC 26621 TaxID=1112213 RepID=UPI00111159BB|nr:hypothetical protein [Sphingomonas sp. PAMC 26621]
MSPLSCIAPARPKRPAFLHPEAGLRDSWRNPDFHYCPHVQAVKIAMHRSNHSSYSKKALQKCDTSEGRTFFRTAMQHPTTILVQSPLEHR